MPFDAPPSPERTPISKEMVTIILKTRPRGDSEALQFYVDWIKQEEANTPTAKEVLQLDIKKGEVLVEAGYLREAFDVIEPIVSGSDLDNLSQFDNADELYERIQDIWDAVKHLREA